jgi:hypothetical protein
MLMSEIWGCIKYVNITLQNIILCVMLWSGKLYMHNIEKEVCYMRIKYDSESGPLSLIFTSSRQTFRLLLVGN